MKKKILLTTHTLNIGGVERSFISLLENLDYSQYEVDVFVYQHGGELFHEIPYQVNILPELMHYNLLLQPISESIKKNYLSVVLIKVFGNLISKWRKKVLPNKIGLNDSIVHPWLYKIASFFLPNMSTQEYDAVFAFLHPNFFEVEKVKSKRKAAWIHTDYSFLNIDRALELSMWKKFDYIFGVSEDNVNAFKNVFPELSEKVDVFENILSINYIHKQANLNTDNEIAVSKAEYNILSIGRFSYQKNFENIPVIANFLREKGVSFKWFIIGYGGKVDEEKIIKTIELHKIQNQVIILGKKINPYPYIKACDVYIQPSRFEGKAVTVREAQILHKPVVITDFPSSSSQLKDGFDGVIVPLENEKAAIGIVELLNNKDKINYLINNTRSQDYSNIAELQKINNIVL